MADSCEQGNEQSVALTASKFLDLLCNVGRMRRMDDGGGKECLQHLNRKTKIDWTACKAK